MKKRIIALIALVAMMATMLTVTVSAELFVNDTFDTPPASGNLADVPGWTAYDGKYFGNVSFEDGVVKITHTDASVTRPFWRRSFTVPGKEFVILFDFMIGTVGNISWQFRAIHGSGGDNRVINTNFNNNTFEADVWYDVMIRSYNGGKDIDMHYKKKTDSNWKKASISSHSNLPDDWFNSLTGEYILSWDTGADNFIKRNGEGMSIDNLRVFTGENIVSNGFKLDAADIDAVTDVTAAGTLKAECEVYSDNISFDSQNVMQTDKTVKAILVTFDKDGKMVGCNAENQDIKGGVTSIAPTLAITAADAAAIADNGYIATYIWNGMQPVGELIDLGTAPISSTHSDN